MTDTIRVLYVDDDPASLRMRGTFIAEHERIDVVTESTVAAGLERLDSSDVDCVLSDVEMPGRGGLQFLECVRERAPHFPFIVFCTDPSADLVEDALAAGATDCVPKSIPAISYRLLTHRILEAVEHHRLRQRLDRADEVDHAGTRF
jgi:DNA-binding NarL/FixJ family response regulator